jgi:mevalonate kinase
MADEGIITASAPGSLMLLGEHAVLHGHRALVCAINRRITITLEPLEDEVLKIRSTLGTYQSPLNNLVDHPSLGFVVQAVAQHVDQLPFGFELQIASDFSADIGFGSSAAVTVATHAAVLRALLGEQPDAKMVFSESLKTVQTVQGRGSGADLAASVYGGVVCYTTEPSFHAVDISVPLTAVYCGYKTPTPEVILKVGQLRAADPEKYERIYSQIDAYARTAVVSLEHHDFPEFGNIINLNQELMNDMGVNTPELQEIVAALQAEPDIFGAKISGSGLGDCAVGIGYAELKGMGYPVHHLEITPAGCQFHE